MAQNATGLVKAAYMPRSSFILLNRERYWLHNGSGFLPGKGTMIDGTASRLLFLFYVRWLLGMSHEHQLPFSYSISVVSNKTVRYLLLLMEYGISLEVKKSSNQR